MLSTSLSPNTQPDDMGAALLALLSPWRWRRVSCLATTTAQVEKSFPGQKVTLTSSGRAALYYALKAFGIGPGDEVILQAFTCLAVPAAIKWTGAKPIFADINPQNYNLNPSSVKQKISQHTKAIIVQHTFGIPAPISDIREIASRHQLVVIEDLAHALGGQHNQQKLGTFGHAAILSFGRDKTISSVFGGAVISRDLKLVAAIRQTQAQLSLPPVNWIIQQLLHPLLVPILNRLYFTGSLGKILLVLFQKLRLLSLAVSKREKLGHAPRHLKYRFSPALAPLLNRQLSKLDEFTKHRRQLAQLYAAALSSSFTPEELSDAAWLRFPLPIKNRDQVFTAAKQKHMLLGDWYQSPVAPCALNQQSITSYQPGSCPVAEQVAGRIINLPTHINISLSQARQIVKFIRNTAY